jgi:hypothetical protein
MTRAGHVLGATALAMATLLLATACAAPSDAAPDAGTPTPNATSPSPTPLVSPTETAAAEPTCETIIPASIIEEFEGVGWTARAEQFRVGDITIEQGIQCVWGDFTVATDNVQIYGWAPISEADARDAQDQLVAMGWRRESTADGEIVTESADTTVATDDEGYGLTYLFGDGWVKHADTKQGLLLVVWPN